MKVKHKGKPISYQMLNAEERRIVDRLVMLMWSIYLSVGMGALAILYFIVKFILSFC